MNKILPNAGKVLVKILKNSEKRFGSIILPESDDKKSIKGIIIAVGEYEKKGSFELKADQIVHIPKWSGTEVSLNNENDDEFLIVKIEDILGIEE